MKREILFRAKRVDNGEWVEGYLSKMDTPLGECDVIISWSDRTYYYVVYETVCQFTGLTDKNGTKIFEGDIVNNSKVVCDITDNGCNFENYAEFCSGHYVENKKFVARIDFDFENELFYESENTDCEHFNEECELFGYIAGFEVIGNIFDSPELLK